jgi:hypothetical protein
MITGHKLKVSLPYFTVDLGSHTQALADARQALEELRLEEPSITSNVNADYVSPYDSHRRNTKLQPLCKLAVSCCEYVTETVLGQGLELAVINCWVAEYKPGDFTHRHDHWPMLFSCVIYLDCDQDSAPLILGDTKVEVRTGLMVIFPGWVEHEVLPTVGARSCVAINLAAMWDRAGDV